jgi:hypothetical protein
LDVRVATRIPAAPEPIWVSVAVIVLTPSSVRERALPCADAERRKKTFSGGFGTDPCARTVSWPLAKTEIRRTLVPPPRR